LERSESTTVAAIRGVSDLITEHRTRLNSNNTSGIRGVYWDKSRKRWVAQVGHNYQTIPVGRFATQAEAEAAAVAMRNAIFTHNDGDRVA
jgi:hypothetical protein